MTVPRSGTKAMALSMGLVLILSVWVFALSQAGLQAADTACELQMTNPLSYSPSDPAFPLQWGLDNTGQKIQGVKGKPGADIAARAAWDIERGDTSPVTVAVIDSGIDLHHPDLKDRLWTNPNEIPGNGIDDDGNGYVDDTHGYNWAGISQLLCGDIGGTNQPWYRDFGTTTANTRYAQSITGTGCDLTHVGVALSSVGSPTGEIEVSVRESLDGPDLGSFTVLPSEVTVFSQEAYKRLSTPLRLVEGVTYYLVFKTTNLDPSNYYRIYDRQGHWDDYREGQEYLWDGSNYNGSPADDFYFRTNPNNCPHDDNGHGTAVSGVIAAEPNNIGTVGVSFGARIMPLKVQDSSGINVNVDSASVCDAIRYAADNGANIINMSFPANKPVPAQQDAINYARGKGIPVFAMAGNSADSTVYYPAGYDNVIGVGGTNNLDEKTSCSCTNSYVDICAPAQDIYVISQTQGGYFFTTGTSMATAYASGMAALILSAKPSFTPSQVEQAIEQYADDLGPPGRDDSFGYGRVNVCRTLKAIMAPHIDSLSSSSGKAGSEVVITGTNFRDARGGSCVCVGSSRAETTFWSDTRIGLRVPDGVVGKTSIRVTTAAGSSNGVSYTVDSPTWYLAEGTTAWGFSDHVTIENPNGSQLTARVTYITTVGKKVIRTLTLLPESQTTLDPVYDLGQADFSTVVECTDTTKNIAVDSTVSWTGQGAASPEAHASVGVTSPAKAWYLAEGSSAWRFECWLPILNPGAADAKVDFTYMIEGGGLKKVTHQVKAHSRDTFNMKTDIGEHDASVKLVSDQPVVPERAMYRDSRREGHDSIGTTSPAYDFYLAEGTTAWGFTTYVLVQNPNSSPTTVTLTYMTPAGPKAQPVFTISANSRRTIRVNDALPSTDFSTQVHGTKPIIAERSMYWGAGTTLGEACHASIGLSSPHMTFYLPDGQTSNGYETYTCVQNPNPGAVTVRVSYLPQGGGKTISFTDEILPNARRTYDMADKIESGRSSIIVQSLDGVRPIMVERSMYWNSRGAGTNTIGAYSD